MDATMHARWDSEWGGLDNLIDRCLAEDLAAGDITSRATVPMHASATAELVAKSALVVCGLPIAGRVFAALDARVHWRPAAQDGAKVLPGAILATVEGNARALLAAERTALNLVQRMSGIATTTRAFVEVAAGRCRVTDTRKTMPGLRSLDRYAVRCGGGHNHRNDLGGGVLIKENHIRCAGGIEAAIKAARAVAAHCLRVECEVTNPHEVDEALRAGADVILLDNMDDAGVLAAVARIGNQALVEVSGNVTLERLPRLAAMGVDLVSVGALTHSVAAADISLLFHTADR